MKNNEKYKNREIVLNNPEKFGFTDITKEVLQ